MSDLQELCETLNGINRDSARMANELVRRAQQLKQAASRTVAVAAGSDGTAHGGIRAATALQSAARAVEEAALLLLRLASAGEEFVAKHQGRDEVAPRRMAQSENAHVSVTASASRTSEHTEVHKCRSCDRAFWVKLSWNKVTVCCPNCGEGN